MLAHKLAAIRSSLVRNPKAFTEARARRAELARFATPLDVAAALEPSAGASTPSGERYAIVAALVAEHHLGASPVWASLLLVAFQPMLLRFRARMGLSRGASRKRAARASDQDEERDARVLAAFVEALAAVRAEVAGVYVAIALQRVTLRVLVAERAIDRRSATEDAFDEDAHSPCTPHALTLGDACVDAAWSGAHERKLASLTRPRARRRPPLALPHVRRSAA